MAKVTIDGTEYETDGMSSDAKAQIQNVMYCDRKLEELKNEAAVIQTARNAYARSLSEMLAGDPEKAN
ncbi:MULTISPECIES: DUF6447 family protein [Roseobacteraceae]|uniref:Uncharacterized protein n=1 Tax=Pseudosulfitobacter pseudonitzschiae TaxID=1402135 RepID=A0A221K6R2_9RHOB|nr:MULTISPECIES: DUF6447 family protein [Roseobacteraceae]ASM74688.1 hypothetical protein SULPSESMR1_04994 [Pseudosulfitobacter pseudonitzschiae]